MTLEHVYQMVKFTPLLHKVIQMETKTYCLLKLKFKMKEFRSVLYHEYWCWLEYLPNITITQPLLIKLWLTERGKISTVAA